MNRNIPQKKFTGKTTSMTERRNLERAAVMTRPSIVTGVTV